MEWESLDMGFSDFLYWACFGDVQKFHETFRWEGWVEEIRHMDGNQGVLIYPFLWADGDPVTDHARSVVPAEELWKIFVNDSKLK